MAKILFLVEDISRLDSLKYEFQELEEAGYDLIRLVGSDKAFAEVDRNDADAVIIPLWMPTGERYAAAPTRGGMRTGLFLLRDIRQRNESKEKPCILYYAGFLPDEFEECKRRVQGDLFTKLVDPLKCEPSLSGFITALKELGV